MQTIFRQHLSLPGLFGLPVLLTAVLSAASTVHAETPEQRLAAAGYTLPPATSPVATYVTSRQVGNLLFLSGHGECGDEFTTGKLGVDLSIEQGAASAEKVGLCMLATIKAAVGELSRVKQFVRILGMVNASDDFTAHPKVINGFSDLMVVAFGDAGKGARAAVGMASLPFREPLINYARARRGLCGIHRCGYSECGLVGQMSERRRGGVPAKARPVGFCRKSHISHVASRGRSYGYCHPTRPARSAAFSAKTRSAYN